MKEVLSIKHAGEVLTFLYKFKVASIRDVANFLHVSETVAGDVMSELEKRECVYLMAKKPLKMYRATEFGNAIAYILNLDKENLVKLYPKK
jgi:predicted ArsR family transcriptional regulator